MVRPPPEPPPKTPTPVLPSNTDSTPSIPPCSLFDELSRPTSPMSIVDLRYDQELESAIAQLPTMPSILDSVTHVVCSP